MAEEKSATYRAWRTSIRGTLKWYIGALVGLGSLLAGGLSLAILPDLTGSDQLYAAALGAVIIGLILYGTWRVQEALFLRPFPRKRLAEDDAVRARLAPYLETMLPGGENWLSDVVVPERTPPVTDPDLQLLDKLIVAREEARVAHPFDADAFAELDDIHFALTDFASYQSLEHRIRTLNQELMVLFVVLVAVGAHLMTFWGTHKTTEATTMQVQFSAGSTSWWDYASNLQATCGLGPFDAKGQPNAPFDGWWTITLDGPSCKGVTLTVPNAVIQASSSASQ